MDNFLENGAVLPSGLLGSNEKAAMEGFNKTYRNTAMRMGIVVRSYAASNPKNMLKLTTEYDVLVFEQNEDRGSSVINYKNCISSEGMGSIADFFEKNLRVRENFANNTTLINTTNQNGAVVLIHCLDGVSDKGIITGFVTHPDRETTLLNEEPYLEGEYNGANIKVNTDGSASFTFNGATDNDGNIIDASQGPTVIQIEKDGSFQLNHSTIAFRLDRNGTATLTTNKDLVLNVTGDINVTGQGKAVVNVTGDANVTSKGNVNVEGKMINLGANASDAVIKGDTFKKYFDTHIHPTAVGPTGPPVSPMPPPSLSTKVRVE